MTRTRSNRGSKSGHTRKTTSHVHPDHLATFHGIHHWHKHVFEELGWMILAKKYGYMDKVYAYKNSLQRLKDTIEKRMSTIKDTDRKKDLSILHKNIITLQEHANQDL